MAQQTAVDWLIEQLNKNENIRWRGAPVSELTEQAKAIEQQQIKDAVIYGLDEDGHTGDWKISVAQNYYNKPYNK